MTGPVFGRLPGRVEEAARKRAAEKADELAAAIAAAAPGGIRAERVEEGVLLSGRGLRLRWVREPRLRWLARGDWR